MKLTELHEIAKAHGINPDNIFKTELIRTIQMKEGNFDCYATAYSGVCDQFDCRWREDCFAAARNRSQM
jgi:hypothetical protein